MLLLVGLASATTLAVLPLEQEGEHPGLGAPLAGMLIADLSEVEGLTLVERSRLDAVLAEIELGEQGYLDPATAQAAGSGLGAQLVVVGSYAVVADQFLLDARIVSVETGDILEAASASGSPADFVAVEKELVEALVDDLQLELSGAAKRRVIVQTPTESFDAFRAYGAGLDARARGNEDAAQASWSQALVLDPGYEAPKMALAELKAGVEQRAEQRFQAEVEAWYAVREAALAATPSSIEDPSDNRQLAELAVHLDMLRALDRPCERYEVMWAHVRKHGLPAHHETYPAFLEESYALHEELGLTEPGDNWAHNKVQSSAVNVFRGEDHYLFDLVGWVADPRIVEGDGLLADIELCFPPEQRPQRVREARVLTEVSGGGEVMVRTEESLGALMRLHEAWSYASVGRLDEADIADLVALEAKWVDGYLTRIVAAAEGWESRQAALLGLDPEVLWGITRAYATVDESLIRNDTAWCRELVRIKKDFAQFRLDQLAQSPDAEAWITEQLWSIVAAPRDLGCLVGVEARYSSAEQVYEHVHSAAERVPADRAERCLPKVDALKTQLDPSYIVQESPPGTMNAQQAAVALNFYYQELVVARCVTD